MGTVLGVFASGLYDFGLLSGSYALVKRGLIGFVSSFLLIRYLKNNDSINVENEVYSEFFDYKNSYLWGLPGFFFMVFVI